MSMRCCSAVSLDRSMMHCFLRSFSLWIVKLNSASQKKKTYDDSQLNHVLTRGKLVFHTWPDRFGYVFPLNIINLNLKTDFFYFCLIM